MTYFGETLERPPSQGTLKSRDESTLMHLNLVLMFRGPQFSCAGPNIQPAGFLLIPPSSRKQF